VKSPSTGGTFVFAFLTVVVAAWESGWAGTCICKGRLELTARQRDVLRLCAQGYTDKEIAARLTLSVSTVRTYLHRLYTRNGLAGRTNAVAVFLLHCQFGDST